MTAETKARAQEKRKKFTYKTGYPESFRDHSKLRIDRGDLVGNGKRANELEYERNIDKLGRPIDRAERQMTPQTVNAYHDPTKNEIVFPAAILQPPFFNLRADDAVNYGAIGVVIGHATRWAMPSTIKGGSSTGIGTCATGASTMPRPTKRAPRLW